MDNKISIVIPPADLQAIKDAIAVLQAKLEPNLISLTIEELRQLNKMGEASRPYVEKVTKYVQTNQPFITPFNKVDERQKVWTLFIQLEPLYNILNQIVINLDDPLMAAGARALEHAIIY